MFNQKFFFTLLVSLLLTVGLTLSCNSSEFKTSDKLGLTDDGKNGADGTGENGEDGKNGDDGKGGDDGEDINIDDITRDDGEDGAGNVCKWFDDENPDYKAQVPGFPAGALFPIKDFKDKGIYDGDNFAVNLTLYKITYSKSTLKVGDYVFYDPGKNYNIEYTPYSVLIADYKKPTCVATAAKTGSTKERRASCFDPRTKILMADKTEKAIMHVQPGEKIFNPILNKSFTVQNLIEGPEADKPMYEIGYNNSTVKVTSGHAFITDKGLKAAKNLKKGDMLKGSDNKFHKVTVYNVLPVNPHQRVINIALVEAAPDNELEHALIANGVLTGDFHLQKMLFDAEKALAKNKK